MTYVVIFRAKIAQFDDEYSATAEKLRHLALREYGCRDFTSWTQGDEEIAISWWDSLEAIRAWKADPEHSAAQKEGRTRWYESVNIQVLELVREYT